MVLEIDLKKSEESSKKISTGSGTGSAMRTAVSNAKYEAENFDGMYNFGML